MDTVRHASAILRSFEIEPRPLDRLVERHFRRNPKLGSRARREIADAVFGVSRWMRRIDALLRSRGHRKPSNADRVRFLLEESVGSLPREAFSGSDAEYHSLPDWLYALLQDERGIESAAQIASALNSSIAPTLRINSLSVERDEAIASLRDAGIAAEKTKLSPYGIRLEGRVGLRSLPLYRDGLVEVQDESSQLAVILSSPSRGLDVLDACAGAGGKSLMMAMLMGNEGRIVAGDVERDKLDELKRRSRRAGVNCIEIMQSDTILGSNLKRTFDLVFIDAPCSGSGTIRRNPDLKWRISPRDIDSYVVRQRDLIERYADFVKPGGVLIYATCSIFKSENEGVVERFIERGGFSLVDAEKVMRSQGIESSGIVSEGGFLMTDPRFGAWDAFFAARMIRI